MAEEFTMPFSKMKALLKETGKSVQPEAVHKFEAKIIEYARTLAKEIAAVTEGKNRKTIYADDIV